jgi:hypothetical protein
VHYNANTTIIGTVLAHSEEHELNNQVYSISETGTQSVHLQMRACSMIVLVTLFNHPSTANTIRQIPHISPQ